MLGAGLALVNKAPTSVAGPVQQGSGIEGAVWPRSLRCGCDGVAALEGDGDFCDALVLAGWWEAPLFYGFDYRIDENRAAANGRHIFDGAVRPDDRANSDGAADAGVLEDVGIDG